MLIDVHVHLLPPRRLAGLLKWIHRYYAPHPVPVDVTLDHLIGDYAKVGADSLFNFAYPIEPQETEELILFNADLRRRHPWIIPWGSLHLENPGKARIVERCIRDHDFLGFKFHPFVQRFDPLDPRMSEAYQALQDARRPCVFHTGFEEFYGLSLPVSTLEHVVHSFPRLPVVFAHSLFPEFAQAWRMLERYDTVWLEMTNVIGALWDERYRIRKFEDQRQVLLEGINAWSDRIMFGSDHPAGMGTLEEIYRTLDGLRLAETVKENLLGETARRFVERFKPGFISSLPPSTRP
ncbi:MAG: amidohydrolase family protein [Candidatus Rokubacteria bacterium]|nr:amidohydrolase family protein [Candidatus Rokubacteria bacterium]